MFEQDRVNTRFQQRVLSDPAIRACLLIGSHGRATADAFSDIDAVLVFDSAESRQESWQRRASFIEGTMPYVATKSFEPDPFDLSTLYSNGTQLDLRYALAAELTPAPMYRRMRVVKDADGWAARFQAECARSAETPPVFTRESLAAIDQQFWVQLWDVLRKLQRGDNVTPFPVFATLLAESVAPLSAELPPDHALQASLLDLRYSAEVSKTIHSLRALVDHFIAARDAVNQAQHLQYFPDRGFEQAFKRVLEKVG